MSIDWVVVSSLATAGGTLALAVATFYSIRSMNRTARNTEKALQVGLRPVLFPSRFDDPKQKLRWGDNHWALLPGGRAVLEEVDDIIYMAMSLRNVGSGIAVLQGWRVEPETPVISRNEDAGLVRSRVQMPEPNTFKAQGRDIYVPPGSEGFWQAAIRDPDDPARPGVHTVVTERHALSVHLLYADQEGGQQTISRFSVTPHPTDEDEWICAVVRHWYLEGSNRRWRPAS